MCGDAESMKSRLKLDGMIRALDANVGDADANADRLKLGGGFHPACQSNCLGEHI